MATLKKAAATWTCMCMIIDQGIAYMALKSSQWVWVHIMRDKKKKEMIYTY